MENGYPTRIRTLTKRVKGACATVTPSGKNEPVRNQLPRPEATANPSRALKFWLFNLGRIVGKAGSSRFRPL